MKKFKKVIWTLTPFILITVIIILLMQYCNPEECFDCDQIQENLDNIERKIKDKDCLDCDWETIDSTKSD